MTGNLRYLALAGVVALASLAETRHLQAVESLIPSPLPPEIQVPEGNAPFLKGSALGTQNYLCMLSTTGATAGKYIWNFIGPQATLFISLKWGNSEIRQQIATHFLSINPAENVARPSWQSSLDTSIVWGKAIANSTDPRFVSPGAVPWLLLQVTGARRGPAGGEMLLPATYIQRVNTSGGVTPTLTCSETENNGMTAFVTYTADYIFYRATRK